MATSHATSGRTHVTQLVNCLGLGGTERQLVEHLRRLDREVFETDLCCLQKVGEFLPSVQEMSLDPEEFHLRGSLVRPNTAFQVMRLARRMRANGSRLLHCHDFYSNLIGAAAARVAGIPYIVSRRDLGAWIGPGRARVLRMVTRSAPKVLCNAHAIRERLVHEEGLDPSRVVVVPNGLDLSRFDDDAARPLAAPLPVLEGHGPIITMVGNMKHAVKGHADLLLAAAAVVRAVPEVRFVLVGDGELRADLERRARELGIGHAVVFAGRRTDVAAILGRSHIAVSASHAEGLSNALMESMAAKLPVVATGVGGNVELVRDGRTGFVVAKGDPTAMAQRLIDLARQPHLAHRMGLMGRRRIEEEFSATRLAERMQALYAEMLGMSLEVRRAA